MNFFSLFRRQESAPVARDRLQILLAHERYVPKPSDLLTVLREEIVATVAKHVDIDAGKVGVQMNHRKKLSTLEIEIEVPNNALPSSARARAKRPPVRAHRSP
jgi:cell division topological specificity factor